MADLTTRIANVANSGSQASVKQPARLFVPLHIPTQGNGVTRQILLPRMGFPFVVERANLISAVAGAATCTMQVTKLNSDDASPQSAPASADVVMSAAAVTLTSGGTAGTSQDLTLYTPGTSGQTDYKDADTGEYINSTLWCDGNDRLGVEVVTSGGSGAAPVGTVMFTIRPVSGYTATRAN